MELGLSIKERRAALGISQDELAQRIYVSRQTISSWENDKTYPDVQSLLLLANVFGTTIDTLVKGDMDAMEQKVTQDNKTLLKLGGAMLITFVLFLAALGWACWQYFNGRGMHIIPTVALAAVFALAAAAVSCKAEKFKRENDLITYAEILAYMQGKPVDRSNAKSHLLRTSRAARIKDKVITLLVSGAIGAILGYLVALLADKLS